MSADLEHCPALAKFAEKPPHSGLQALFKRVVGLPPQLVLDQFGVLSSGGHGGAVAQQGDQARVRSALRRS